MYFASLFVINAFASTFRFWNFHTKMAAHLLYSLWNQVRSHSFYRFGTCLLSFLLLLLFFLHRIAFVINRDYLSHRETFDADTAFSLSFIPIFYIFLLLLFPSLFAFFTFMHFSALLFFLYYSPCFPAIY